MLKVKYIFSRIASNFPGYHLKKWHANAFKMQVDEQQILVEPNFHATEEVFIELVEVFLNHYNVK